ncbi:TorD/DmsD family molecular chaperone [Natrialba asiatica]|uniref:Anaerobic dehydrogenase-like protein n=1 Tax=Natrialba asiatica (strain ATCC 700177 / DSM 12278 / JCM 9576 / FERM P-10747 / NBRC 102637 / 172P1) TaxID=29540 RepID=M0AMG4_NATA1|nr:molecular chaperone TorD family protein [Natrialba asiatica]ELY99506.1 anaerobic dehydrogenase-like protein [Natrialba asiatica DSM 12278]
MSVDQRALYVARLELVNFLIDAFADAPSTAFVETLLDDGITVPDGSVGETLDRGFERLETVLDENEGRDPELVQDELEREFTRLFVGPRPPILPHETYYREDTDFRGTGLTEVEAGYGAAGWSPPDDYPEENDYVAVELAFLRNLIRRQRTGDEETFGYQRVFHEEHLSAWIDDLAADIRERTDEPFYAAVADVLEGDIAFEEEIAMQMA